MNRTTKGVFGGTKERLQEEDSSKRYRTDPEVIEDYATKMDITQEDAKFLIDELMETIRYLVKKNGYVTIRKFGTVRLVVSKRSKMYMPKTGEEIKVPLRYLIRLIPSETFKNYVNCKVKENIIKIHELSK